MNRTIKFQASNLKAVLLTSTYLVLGFIALGIIIGLVYDPFIFDSMRSNPAWLTFISLIAMPFSAMLILYPMSDGMMYFDSALRFGISRKSYFRTQMVTYGVLAVLSAFASGLSEVEWTGTAASYFSTIARKYLTLEGIFSEFTIMLLVASLALSYYRYKSKAFIPLVFVFMVGSLALAWLRAFTPTVFEEGAIFSILEFLSKYMQVIIGFFQIGVIFVYYLFVTRFEIQK